MILRKLQEALAQAETERRALDEKLRLINEALKSIDEVEGQLRTMVAKLSTNEDDEELLIFEVTQSPVRTARSRQKQKRDKIDEFVDILRAEGKPLHIVTLAERYSEKVGHKVLRTDIEPGINRHIGRTKTPRIHKFKPSTFGLPEWRSQPSLAQIA